MESQRAIDEVLISNQSAQTLFDSYLENENQENHFPDQSVNWWSNLDDSFRKYFSYILLDFVYVEQSNTVNSERVLARYAKDLFFYSQFKEALNVALP